ncbi:MAG: hypothetical protein Q8L23_09630 [Caulobacter sp.]|nr:hypothetical protein [Caulobacter sp.]
MRVLMGLCVLLLLGACNRVHTDQPLFFASDAPDAPRLRDGLWVVQDTLGIDDDDQPCRFDARKPVTRWPKCAQWVLVRGGELLAYDGEKGKREWQSMGFVLADVDPMVLQLGMKSGKEKEKLDFQYFGFSVTQRMSDGRIEAYAVWPVLCGPPPPEGTKEADGAPRFATLEPLPGLTIDGNNCTTGSSAAVINAARASRAWEAEPGTARWVRDTWP